MNRKEEEEKNVLPKYKKNIHETNFSGIYVEISATKTIVFPFL